MMSNIGKISASARLPSWTRLVCGWANRITSGQLTIRFPNGCEHIAQGSLPGPSARLDVQSSKLVWKLTCGGSLGFARSYIDGDWDTPDLGALLQLGHANEAAFGSLLDAAWPARLAAFMRHRLRANTRAGSRRNIAFHYDLGNEFYRLWLDKTMTYSSALFLRDDQCLADAQLTKYARIAEILELGPDDHVLEIGCGWGGFAEYAAREKGCRVTGLTLSREQEHFARERLSAAGLSDKSQIRLEDYRDCQGQFDKIVSIEMFEAVGEENWTKYFDALRKLLKPGGRALVQVITVADSHFARYRRNADFIQTYIFPGGMLPSPAAFRSAAAEQGLAVPNETFFGADYDRTLLAWDKAFVEAWHLIEPLGFDARFKRMWRYYFHYCAVGFRSRRIDVGQFLLEDARNLDGAADC
jgi:cyclopropane-fatty-acyl-phospholipid synthase